MLTAQQRNEICFGIKLIAENGPQENGSGMHIIPRKETTFQLHPDDLLITLAEDET